MNVVRLDADGIHEIEWLIVDDNVRIEDSRTLDSVYVVASDESVRSGILQRRQIALDHEANNTIEIDALKALKP